jgi:hypothetical protein
MWEALYAHHTTIRSKRFRSVLSWMVIGYFSFLLPLVIVYVILAPARAAVASIMCGFAVIFAFILAFEIVPKFYHYDALAKKKKDDELQ